MTQSLIKSPDYFCSNPADWQTERTNDRHTARSHNPALAEETNRPNNWPVCHRNNAKYYNNVKLSIELSKKSKNSWEGRTQRLKACRSMTPSARVMRGQTGIIASVNTVDPMHATSFVRRNLFSMSASDGRLSSSMKRFSPNSLQHCLYCLFFYSWLHSLRNNKWWWWWLRSTYCMHYWS